MSWNLPVRAVAVEPAWRQDDQAPDDLRRRLVEVCQKRQASDEKLAISGLRIERDARACQGAGERVELLHQPPCSRVSLVPLVIGERPGFRTGAHLTVAVKQSNPTGAGQEAGHRLDRGLVAPQIDQSPFHKWTCSGTDGRPPLLDDGDGLGMLEETQGYAFSGAPQPVVIRGVF